MTNVRWIAGVVVLVLVGAVVRDVAARAPQTREHAGFHVIGVPGGGIDCGSMMNNLRDEKQSWRAFYTSYMTGFVTGANFVSYLANGRNPNVGYDTATEAMFASVEQYCGQNPSKNIHEAVESVYSQLAAR